MSEFALICRSVAVSFRSGEGHTSAPSMMRTRQVEQRALPPHIETCGMRKERLASRTVQPRGTCTERLGYEIEIRSCLLRPTALRVARAQNATATAIR